VHYEREGVGVEQVGARRGLFGRAVHGGGHAALRRRRSREAYTEVFGPDGHEVWIGGERVSSDSGGVFEGLMPVVHVQNQSQPLVYAGVGEVEPLLPLQDELNTRLSDRASRVTMQSFKMYLAKGIDGFSESPVSPGTVWSTDNPAASVESFGGDASSPSEESHIGEIRQAMDKVSGVPPVASGVLEARIGNLSSASALRVTMVGLIAKTNRKRVTYGRGICSVSTLVLEAASRAGLLDASAPGCGVDIDWPDPLPIGEEELSAGIRARRDLGVPDERIAEVYGVVPTPGRGAAGDASEGLDQEDGDG
ncbi:MAG: phage portal protein, partial [Planctomycetota bacterium]